MSSLYTLPSTNVVWSNRIRELCLLTVFFVCVPGRAYLHSPSSQLQMLPSLLPRGDHTRRLARGFLTPPWCKTLHEHTQAVQIMHDDC